MQGKAASCPLRFSMVMLKQEDDSLTVTFTGDMQHDITQPVSRHTGEKEKGEKK